jgi:uncharacterized repeat protein (TIGR01451 family)
LANDSNSTSSTASGAGSLTATTPRSPAEALAYRVRTGGTYYAKVSTSSGAFGDYLVSVSRNCRISPPTDLAVTQSDSPDPVAPGANVTYTILERNQGTAPASVVALRDYLPSGSTLVSATPTQGACTGSGPVLCHLGTIAGGNAATVTLVVTAPGSAGTMTNNAQVTTMVIDSNPANDASAESTSVGSVDSDHDGVPDGEDCAPSDPSAWAVPGEATELRFPAPEDKTLMQWNAPSSPGGSVVYYDVLRSTTASNFATPGCVAGNITATSAVDAAPPLPVFYYLVRAENVCGDNLGSASDETPRTGGPCP